MSVAGAVRSYVAALLLSRGTWRLSASLVGLAVLGSLVVPEVLGAWGVSRPDRFVELLFFNVGLCLTIMFLFAAWLPFGKPVLRLPVAPLRYLWLLRRAHMQALLPHLVGLAGFMLVVRIHSGPEISQAAIHFLFSVSAVALMQVAWAWNAAAPSVWRSVPARILVTVLTITSGAGALGMLAFSFSRMPVWLHTAMFAYVLCLAALGWLLGRRIWSQVEFGLSAGHATDSGNGAVLSSSGPVAPGTVRWGSAMRLLLAAWRRQEDNVLCLGLVAFLSIVPLFDASRSSVREFILVFMLMVFLLIGHALNYTHLVESVRPLSRRVLARLGLGMCFLSTALPISVACTVFALCGMEIPLPVPVYLSSAFLVSAVVCYLAWLGTERPTRHGVHLLIILALGFAAVAAASFMPESAERVFAGLGRLAEGGWGWTMVVTLLAVIVARAAAERFRLTGVK